jgi:hypothetical protein
LNQNFQQSLSLYAYVDQLFHENNKLTTSSLRLSGMSFIPYSSIKSIKTMQLSRKLNISYFATNNYITVEATPADSYNVVKRYEVVQRLLSLFDNSTMLNITGFAYSYGLFFGRKNSGWKDIYNTDFVQFLTKSIHAANEYIVPMNRGYFSHFREQVTRQFQNQTLPSEQLYFDVEHLIYLLKTFNLDFQLK